MLTGYIFGKAISSSILGEVKVRCGFSTTRGVSASNPCCSRVSCKCHLGILGVSHSARSEMLSHTDTQQLPCARTVLSDIINIPHLILTTVRWDWPQWLHLAIEKTETDGIKGLAWLYPALDCKLAEHGDFIDFIWSYLGHSRASVKIHWVL